MSNPVTYTSVNVPWRPDIPLIIKDTSKECIEKSKLFEMKRSTKQKLMVSDWILKGHAFWADNVGLEKLTNTEKLPEAQRDEVQSWHGAELYVNIGTTR